jgi:O-antigen ligase
LLTQFQAKAIPPAASNSFALRVMQVGAIAVVLAASLYTAFDLDRFFIPKELVLHITAVLAGLFTLRRRSRSSADWLLFAYALLSAASVLFAQNRWLGFRALAITASGIVLFRSARAVNERVLLNTLAAAVVLASATSLLEAYGIRTLFFASTRIPGGTLGNRNFVAHAAAFGLPLLSLAAERARRMAFPLVGIAIVSASLVLARSRAAWIATAAMLVVFVLLAPSKRLFGIALFAAIGVGAALFVPNALRWHSENPYIDSVRGMLNGRGRLTQYERTLLMAGQHPILGVGPGHWAVNYPREGAARNDPSMSDTDPGMTTNPWPSSDWMAFASERGFAAMLLLAIIFITLALKGSDDRPRSATLAAMLVATAIAGLFDAVLLLPLPAFIVWSAAGALASSTPAQSKKALVAHLLLVAIALAGAARSAAQLTSMSIYSTRSDRRSLELASRIDPGNYRLQLRLGRGGSRSQRCAHARAAHEMYPAAQAAIEASRGCK